MPQNHIIKQQVVEIFTGNGVKTEDLFNDTSRMFNNRILDITNQVFDKLIDERQIIHLDTLTLNMPAVSFPYREEEFVENYKRILEEELLKRLKKIDVKPLNTDLSDGDSLTKLTNKERLLESLLLRGILPWWANTSVTVHASDVLNDYLSDELSDARTFLLTILSFKTAAERIAHQMPFSLIEKVIHIIEPAESSFIVNYHKQVSNIQEEQTFINTELAGFKKTLWLFILNFLSQNHGSRFNRKMFVKINLEELAAHYNISFDKILFYFTEALRFFPQASLKDSSLTGIINEIAFDYNEEVFGPSTNLQHTQTITKNKDIKRLQFEQILHYLKTGYLNYQLPKLEREEAGKLFVSAAEMYSSLLIRLIDEYGNQKELRKRLITELGENSVLKTVDIIEPAGAPLIYNYIEYTTHVQKKARLVNTPNKDFKDSLWELVLNFLFTERGSVFNSRIFLEGNIKALARHYNLDFKTTLAFLVQAVGESNTDHNPNSDFFFNLVEILKSEKTIDSKAGNTETNESVYHSDTLAKTKKRKKESGYIHSLILYWLEHGENPWWAEEDNNEITGLFENLIKQQTDEAFSLFTFSLIQGKIHNGFFETYPDLIFNLFLKRIDAKPIIENALSLVSGIKELTKSSSQRQLKILISESLLRSITISGFKPIIAEDFFKLFLEGVKPNVSEAIFTKIIGRYKTLQKVNSFPEFETLNNPTYEKHLRARALVYTTGLYPFKDLEAIFIQYANETGFPDKEHGPIAFDILVFFLVNNKLPLNQNLYDPNSQKALARTILLFLSNHHPNLVFKLFNIKTIQTPQKDILYELLYEVNLHKRPEFNELIFSNIKIDLAGITEKPDLIKHLDSLQLNDLFRKIKENNHSANQLSQLKNSFKISIVNQYASVFFKGNDFISIVNTFWGNKAAELSRNLIYLFSLIVSDSFEREKLLTWLREYIFSGFSSDTFSLDTKISIRDFIHFLHYKKQVNSSFLRPGLKKVMESFSNYDKQLIEQFMEIDSSLTYFSGLNSIQNELEAKLFMKENTKEEEEPEPESEKEKTETVTLMSDGEHIYINNAGLVLLHPFIPTLLSKLSLTQKSVFPDAEAINRAIHLLQFAVSGNEEAEEHELVLNKLLCGTEPEDVVFKNFKLGEEEKNVCLQMLQVVMQQWDKLRNTTEEGFRGSFLLRKGYLVNTEEAWLLRVEQRGYDILLQTLPWSFGMIKYSWMKKPILVEWT